MKKEKEKVRRFICQAKRDGKRCRSYAIIESTKFIGTTEFQVPLKIRHCLPCGRHLAGMFAKAPIAVGLS